MMRGGGTGGSSQRGFVNETSSSSFGIAGSFPHYKQIIMPADQKAKLLAMHRASRANAGIYVAVVLAVYVILLTILLCRYGRRSRSSSEGSNGPGPISSTPRQQQQQQQTNPSRFFHFTSTKLSCHHGRRASSLCAAICCPTCLPRDDPINEISDYPLTTFTTKIEQSHHIPVRSNSPVSTIINLNKPSTSSKCSDKPYPV